ncbi:bifunctional hydroxymethylpyrimidine kinase/phosphomethylpyrimidine kinase [Piscirickettsia litoralis]|uniref:hydroxymethylpyrimidine kinase n=1 Tax=Piscirickettsia litoralis TaxID=1891921 RepID=A0ABX3A0L9_9GAMM|nr:bifunctional hydroxymethylpyrimidine kinase/phosphomethylpyrimidine kinase [Piscirickettsia litoralis]ODN42409.1 bifunctional hydroxymethylpyrimidine kinase/phosphomethylpyrimidine kinase [Piscirickettsia litoralis]
MSKKQGQNQYQRVLTIAGSDSGGGAGIQADLKTFSALGCYGMSVISAITAQNTLAVSAVDVVKPEMVKAQFDMVMGDIGADAIKIGMLANAEITKVVIDCIRSIPVDIPVIFDPVLVATSGDVLTQLDNLELFKQLIGDCSLITPNLVEAGVLAGCTVESQTDMEHVAKLMVEVLGAKAVLVKGGHLTGDMLGDLLYWQNHAVWFQHEKIPTKNTHGTGCTLSSAIAANMAKGHPLNVAVENAIDFLQGAIVKGEAYSLGKGQGPVHHFYKG